MDKSKEWHDRHNAHIGGSDAANILGLGYGSSLETYLQKTGGADPFEGNEKTEWGTRLEDSIRRKYTDESGFIVEGNKYFEHPEHKFMGCEVDGVILGDPRGPGVLECKNVGFFTRDKWEDQVPEGYLIQLHHNMTVTGFSWGVLAVLIGGQEYRSFEFKKDDELSAILIQKESDFWYNHVLAGVPPDATGASLEVISSLYPADNGNEIIVDDDAIGSALKTFMLEKTLTNQHEKAMNTAKAIVQTYMGEASKGIYQEADQTIAVNWGTRKGRVSFNAKAFEKDHPKLYKKYSKQGSDYRVFTVKAKLIAIENKREVA